MSDTLAARLRNEVMVREHELGKGLRYVDAMKEAADALDTADRQRRKLRDLCNERRYSVMLWDGRMEDALLAVDVARIMGWDTPEKGEKE